MMKYRAASTDYQNQALYSNLYSNKMCNSLLAVSDINHKYTKEACGIIRIVSPRTDEKVLYRLNKLVVQWVLANPEPIKLEKVDYAR